MQKRKLKDWITAYLTFVDQSEPPTIFKEWCAVSALAAAMQRKYRLVWDPFQTLYPNMYIVLVGPAGSRKGTAITPARNLMLDAGIPLSAESTTREALVRRLAEAAVPVPQPDPDLDPDEDVHCSLTVVSPELTVFLTKKDEKLVEDVTDWFDCPNNWSYETKTQGKDVLRKVWLNLIGATTPSKMQGSLPQSIVDGGLASRIIFVYGDRRSKLVTKGFENDELIALRDYLLDDLITIFEGDGDFTYTEEYNDAYARWYEQSVKTPPIEDYHFESYLERRPLHLRKLSMIMNVSRGGDLLLIKEDLHRALHLLLRTEKVMPNVFRAYGRLDIAETSERLLSFIMKHKSGLTKARILREFYKDATVEEIDQLLKAYLSMNIIETKRVMILEKPVLMIYAKEGPGLGRPDAESDSIGELEAEELRSILEEDSE